MFAYIARTVAFQPVHIHSMARSIEPEHRSAILLRPPGTQVDHAAGMGVAASDLKIGGITFHLALRTPISLAARVRVCPGPMPMVGNGFNGVISIGERGFAKE